MLRSLGAASLVALALSAVGCGDSSPDDPALRFVGTWQYGQAQSAATCPGSEGLDTTPKGNEVLARGTMHDLADLTALSSNPKIFCDFGFDIKGPVASVAAGSACALLGSDLLTVKSWTFSLTGPDQAEEVASADIAITIQGTTTICTYDLQAQLTRVSKD
jgi:hypothetical protein